MGNCYGLRGKTTIIDPPEDWKQIKPELKKISDTVNQLNLPELIKSSDSTLECLSDEWNQIRPQVTKISDAVIRLEKNELKTHEKLQEIRQLLRQSATASMLREVQELLQQRHATTEQKEDENLKWEAV